ncbi:MAG: VCBS repeat-containing protein, partial [Candidatus Fervidibacter sacchari]
MKRWLLGLSAIVVVVVLALVLWRSSSLIVERTVIAELPLGINRLVPTDLDGDGEPEILAVCSHWYWKDIKPILFFYDHDRTDDPRVWFIRSPLGKPQATQLPYVCRWGWQLSSLPLQRSVLVEEGELLLLGFRKVWKASRLGWLKMAGEHLTFEPLLPVKGQVTHQLIAGGKSPSMLIKHTQTQIPTTVRRRFVPQKFPMQDPASIRRFLLLQLQQIRSQMQRLKPVTVARTYAFRLQPDGTWQPIDAKKVKQLPTGDYYGDFDGDGLRDALKRRWLRSRNKTEVELVEVHWGNGATATVVFEERLPKSPPTRIWTADIEGDGHWEIVTWDGKGLTVWKFRKHERRFAPTTQVALKPPRVAPKGGRFSLGMATVPPPPARFEPNFAAIDLNGDGRKEFLLFWEELLITPYSNFLPKEKVAVQVIWQQGGKIKVRQFDSKKIPLPSPLITTWTQNGHRFAFSSETYGRKRFRPRLISFRPLRLELWKMVLEYRSTLFQLPNG